MHFETSDLLLHSIRYPSNNCGLLSLTEFMAEYIFLILIEMEAETIFSAFRMDELRNCKQKNDVFYNLIKMEKSGQKQNRTPLTLEEHYNTADKNYEWEHFRYIVPKHYHQTPIQHLPNSKPEQKMNYLDDLLRIKKTIPAPNAYRPQTQARPLSGKMDKRPRTTLTDAILKQQKALPGPGTYFTRPKTADCKLNRNAPEHRQHYLNEVEYLSSESPGVGEYNLSHTKSHINTPKFCKDIREEALKTQPSVRSLKRKKDEIKEELKTTLVTGTFDWLAAQRKPNHKNYFGKSGRFIGESKYDQKPGPNFYKINMKWNDSKSILKASASSINLNLKSVYYG